MKNKIENLIKEVGINEVESILKELKSKSKVNVKENLKKDFIELLTGCTISFECDDIEYRKDDKLLFYYNKNKNYIFLIYEIWSNFESKYNLNYQELSDLLVGLVEEVLNYKGVTLKENYWRLYHRWKN
jgi:hypothetical protein